MLSIMIHVRTLKYVASDLHSYYFAYAQIQRGNYALQPMLAFQICPMKLLFTVYMFSTRKREESIKYSNSDVNYCIICAFQKLKQKNFKRNFVLEGSGSTVHSNRAIVAVARYYINMPGI